MIVVNFAHPLTDTQRADIERLAGQPIVSVLDARAQFDVARSFAEQSQALIQAVGFTPQEWQTLPLLINLPSFNVIAACFLAEMHGHCGYFPAVLRLRPVAKSVPPQFEVAEILNLQSVRDAARTER